MDLKKEEKKTLQKEIKKLINKGFTSNYSIRKQLKKMGISTTPRTIKKYKDIIATDIIKDAHIKKKSVQKINPRFKKKIIDKKIKKYKKIGKSYYWLTTPCPKCKECFPIHSNSKNAGVICASCGYEFVRELGKEVGKWIHLSHREPVNKNNTKFSY